MAVEDASRSIAAPPPVWARVAHLDRQVAAVAAIIIVALTLRVVTWDPIADGSRSRHVKTALVGAVSAAAVWGLVRIQTASKSRVPLVAAAVVMLSGDALHYVRLANPITRGAPVVGVSTSFAGEAAARRDWEIETGPGGRASFQAGALVLESPPRTPAYVRPRLAQFPDVGVQWWLPLGLAERDRQEVLTWRAAVERTGTYYVVAELRHVLIQAVSYGIHITYPDEGNVMRGHEIQHPAGSDGRTHDWRLERNSRHTALFVDGQQVWSQPPRGELAQARLGETKSDADHAGRMRLEMASFSISLERP